MDKKEYEAAVEKKRAEIEKQVEELEKRDKNWADLFKKHPERKEMYIQKILDSEPIVENEVSESDIKMLQINPAWCRKCLFAHGEAPFEDTPEKRWCEMYRHNNNEQKPSEVYYEGAECEFFEPDIK